ncbi:MAG: DUF1934 domain-containing protein [Ruminococcus sp.]|jgi:uncharacterized beta-barrel protein YwiB (DUF1934 family)|nr:DUF1934 domain-containing protein [Ruminococcus sp.]
MEDKKNEYLISVTGIQEVDGEKDKIELQTIGNYMLKTDHAYIRYKEYDEENPSISSNNVVKIENDSKVTIIRNGEVNTRLILEKGVRHQCHYRTLMGDMMIGVSTDTITNRLNENGGKLHVSYSLDFNNELISNNEFYIDVQEKG